MLEGMMLEVTWVPHCSCSLLQVGTWAGRQCAWPTRSQQVLGPGLAWLKCRLFVKRETWGTSGPRRHLPNHSRHCPCVPEQSLHLVAVPLCGCPCRSWSLTACVYGGTCRRRLPRCCCGCRVGCGFRVAHAEAQWSCSTSYHVAAQLRARAAPSRAPWRDAPRSGAPSAPCPRAWRRRISRRLWTRPWSARRASFVSEGSAGVALIAGHCTHGWAGQHHWSPVVRSCFHDDARRLVDRHQWVVVLPGYGEQTGIHLLTFPPASCPQILRCRQAWHFQISMTVPTVRKVQHHRRWLVTFPHATFPQIVRCRQAWHFQILTSDRTWVRVHRCCRPLQVWSVGPEQGGVFLG
jgi:hypothetical protein